VCAFVTNTSAPTGPLIPKCTCDNRFTGELCSNFTCIGSPTCSGHGSCINFNNNPICSCAFGWKGSDCSLPTCANLNTCSGHGSCTLNQGMPTCICTDGYSGTSCNSDNSERQTVLIAVTIVAVVVGLFICIGCIWLMWRRSQRAAHHAVFFDPINTKSNRVFSKSSRSVTRN
jgi:hypothetical protein